MILEINVLTEKWQLVTLPTNKQGTVYVFSIQKLTNKQ